MRHYRHRHRLTKQMNSRRGRLLPWVPLGPAGGQGRCVRGGESAACTAPAPHSVSAVGLAPPFPVRASHDSVLVHVVGILRGARRGVLRAGIVAAACGGRTWGDMGGA